MFLSLFAAYAGTTTLSTQSVILPADFGPQLVHGCGVTFAKYEGDVTGYWSPGVDDAKQMERALPAYLKQTEVHRPFTDYYRQYVGIVAGGMRLVFVSAFASPSGVREKDFIPADWRDTPVTICGGSTDAWRVAFDPQRKQFSHWSVNGPL